MGKGKASREKAKDLTYFEELDRRKNRPKRKKANKNIVDDTPTIDTTGQSVMQCNTVIIPRLDSNYSNLIVTELEERSRYEKRLEVLREGKQAKCHGMDEWLKKVAHYGDKLAARLPYTVNIDGSKEPPLTPHPGRLPRSVLTRDMPPELEMELFPRN